jgi:hypothetical protein
MEEKSGIIPANEVAQQLFCLSGAALDIDSSQDSDDILEQEFGVICPAIL